MKDKELFGCKLIKGSGESYPNQLYNVLRQQILKGRWKVGDQLPSYNNLSEMCGLSRTPIQDVYSRLENDGYIERIRQKGIFLKSVVSNSNRTLGSIVFAVTDNYGSYTANTQTFGIWDIEELVKGASRRGFRTQIVEIPDPIQKMNVLDADISADAFGIISFVPRSWLQQSLISKSIPIVYIGVEEPFSTPVLNGDLYTTAYLLTKHLIDLNHKKIGLFLTSFFSNFKLDDVIEGHKNAMIEAQLPVNQELIDWSLSLKSTSLKNLNYFFNEFKGFSALLCSTGASAAKIMEVSEFIGLSVPEDLSLACCQAAYISNDNEKTFLGAIYEWDAIVQCCFNVLLNQDSSHNDEVQKIIYRPHIKKENSPTVKYKK